MSFLLDPRHFRTLCSVLTLLLGALTISCMVSIMFAFMGASPAAALATSQVAGLLLSLLLACAGIAYFTTFRGLSAGLALAWQHTPGWLAFAATVCASLAIAGELAYYLVRNADLAARMWTNHLPLLCLACAAVAMCVVHAVGHNAAGASPYEKARW